MTVGLAGARAEQRSGVAQTERMLVCAAVLYRLFGLCQLTLAVSFDIPHYEHPAAVLTLAGVVAAESATVSAVLAARGRLLRWLLLADVAFNMAAIVACGALTAPPLSHTWVFFMYPLTLISSVALGLAFRRLSSVVVLTACLAATYSANAIGWHFDQAFDTLPNVGSYFANTVVAWAVAQYARGGGARLDRARAEAVDRAAALAAERERLRHARMLHDRVLQTLETLAHGDWIRDPAMRSRVAAEASWVRGLVEGFVPAGDDDLATGLIGLIRDRTERGLQVQFNGTALQGHGTTQDLLAPGVARALVDAAGEALTNVAKHAGTTAVMMRVGVTADRLTVSVLDHGCGFDPAATPRRVGLRESIQGRLAEFGGTATIDSAPGTGTYVELTVPRQSDAAAVNAVPI